MISWALFLARIVLVDTFLSGAETQPLFSREERREVGWLAIVGTGVPFVLGLDLRFLVDSTGSRWPSRKSSFTHHYSGCRSRCYFRAGCFKDFRRPENPPHPLCSTCFRSRGSRRHRSVACAGGCNLVRRNRRAQWARDVTSPGSDGWIFRPGADDSSPRYSRRINKSKFNVFAPAPDSGGVRNCGLARLLCGGRCIGCKPCIRRLPRGFRSGA